ncbi:MAG: hypothetical protein DBX55_07615 [Verrucomicrobia bacterium]|nr:MAG: hypothetical protein DBX55_07615 [Verrucomicrobiota bacterium]
MSSRNFSDTVGGLIGKFWFCIDETFARRQFGLFLRGRNCRLTRDIFIFRASLMLQDGYFTRG